jgi:hypothetical protein
MDLNRRFPRYSKLLRLYPAGYRKAYGEQMLQTLADMLDDPEQSRQAVWTRTILDFPLSVAHQQLSYAGTGAAGMPRYMKQNARLGAWLVAPFFLFILLNSFSGQRLRDSLLWHTDFLFIWLVLLPGLAVVFNLAALLRWVRSQRRGRTRTTWSLLTDFRQNWPAVAMIVIGLAILALVFGHDSVRCVSGNPFHELHDWHSTWQCVQHS